MKNQRHAVKTGDTLRPYYGEFLISPIPLELSFNYCSHKCAYCFANLNRPNRRSDLRATLGLLREYRDRDTLEATLGRGKRQECK